METSSNRWCSNGHETVGWRSDESDTCWYCAALARKEAAPSLVVPDELHARTQWQRHLLGLPSQTHDLEDEHE
jgi:hypothetical protein